MWAPRILLAWLTTVGTEVSSPVVPRNLCCECGVSGEGLSQVLLVREAYSEGQGQVHVQEAQNYSLGGQWALCILHFGQPGPDCGGGQGP
jgi:hypothetical protein